VLPKSSEAARPVSVRDSATPTWASRLGIQAAGRQIRNPKSEISPVLDCSFEQLSLSKQMIYDAFV
jgi:hypothetical protein